MKYAYVWLDKVRSSIGVLVVCTGKGKFRDLHQKTWVELEVFESAGVLDLGEVFDEIIDAEFFEFQA